MKLDIVGSVASGKITFAREISIKYQIPFYEKDNVVWERTLNGDKKRCPEEQNRIFKEIIEGENWIVEGSPRKNLNEKKLLNCCLNMGQNIELSRIQNKQCNLLKKCIVNKAIF